MHGTCLQVEEADCLVCVLLDEVESLTRARSAAVSGSEPADAIAPSRAAHAGDFCALLPLALRLASCAVNALLTQVSLRAAGPALGLTAAALSRQKPWPSPACGTYG